MPPKRKALTIDDPDGSGATSATTTPASATTTTPVTPAPSTTVTTTTAATTTAAAPKSTTSSDNNTTTVTATMDGTYIFWYHKESETVWHAFNQPDSDLIESNYVKDPKSNTEIKIGDKIFVKFSDLTYHKGDNKSFTIRRSETVAVWSWEKSRGEFYAFDQEISKKIEAAHRKGQSKVSIDTERYINLSTYEQVRFDDEAKTRRVARSFSEITTLVSPTWYYEDNGAWVMMTDSSEIEKKYQYYLKNGKSVSVTAADGDKILFTKMVKEKSGTGSGGSNTVFVKVKRDNGPAAAIKKSYSQLSEEEKKILISTLLAGGAAAATPVKKHKTDHSSSSSSSSGKLYLPGEEEIIKGDKPMKYVLKPVRHFDNSIADLHFRTAESQFYRLLESSATSYKVTKVEYVVNPKLIKNFDNKKKEYEKAGFPDCSPVFGFHGTASKNIVPICANNFSVPGTNGVAHATDSGWYGKGIYFSEYPEYSIGYISDCSKLLLCKVLLGKSYKCTGLITGQPCAKGFTSHLSPDEKELVIFHPDQILPCYIVHYGEEDDDNGNTKDKSYYSLYSSAVTQGYSNNLAGVKICLSGTMSNTHILIHNLIAKHGGTYSSSVVYGVTHLVSTRSDHTNKSGKVSSAEGSNIPVVSEKWLYDSIIYGKKNEADYTFAAKQSNKKQEIKAVPLLDDVVSKTGSFISNGATIDAAPAKPECKYGATCYRKNAQHFKDFSHPFILD